MFVYAVWKIYDEEDELLTGLYRTRAAAEREVAHKQNLSTMANYLITEEWLEDE